MTHLKSLFTAIVLSFTLIASLSAAEPAAVPLQKNAWSLQGGIFFTDHPGGDFDFRCTVSHPQQKVTEKSCALNVPAILVTIYTPDEHVYKDFYWQDDASELTKEFSCKIPDAQKGIWQIRVSQDSTSKFSCKFELAPGKIDAVMPARCWLWHQTGKMLDKTYFMVPKDVKKELRVLVHNCQIEFFDLNGTSIAKVEKSGPVKLEPGQIYQYRNSTESPGWNWSGCGGWPVIYCSTPDFAKKLNASRIELADGRLVPFAVQKRIEEWKKTLKKEDLFVPDVNLQNYKDALLADPQSRHLMYATGLLSAAPYLLSIQDTDPASPHFGSAKHEIGGLAFLYTWNKPYNPYYKCKGLLNRVVLYHLDSLTNSSRFSLKENGTIYELDYDSNYAGADGMIQVPEYTAFYLLSPELTPEVREMWSEALGYPVRRFFSDRVSCENQSGHWPAKLYLYGKASDNPLFVTMAENFIRNMGDTKRDYHIRTGYLQEAYGPDATYQGLNTCLLAYYARFSQDPEAIRLLDRIFTLFNHTVAPEPDGKIYGASGFSHRTPGGWNIRQYGGGTRLVADKLESAACWHLAPSQEPAWDAEYVQKMLDWAADKRLKFYDDAPDWLSYCFKPYAQIWNHCPEIPVRPDSVLPAVSSENFDHIYNNEFFFVRRKSYYAAAFAGKTAGSAAWQNNANPFPGKWAEQDGIHKAQSGAVFGAMQGPQMFWTPEFGTSLLCMNWNLYTRWNAWLTDGTTQDWPDYFTSARQYDDAKKELVLTHKFHKTPSCTIKRTLLFTDDGLSVKVDLQGDTTGRKLVEQLPYLNKQGIRSEFCIGGEWKPEPGENVSALRWKNTANAGVIVKFSRPVTVRKGVTSENQGVQIASFEAEIGSGSFSYTVSAEK